jgi:hypothetical protein
VKPETCRSSFSVAAGDASTCADGNLSAVGDQHLGDHRLPFLTRTSSRSSCEMPPQTPNGCLVRIANALHAFMTAQSLQMLFAARARRRRAVPRSLSGWKNNSGSTPRHAASTCHDHSSSNGRRYVPLENNGIRITWVIRLSQSHRRTRCRREGRPDRPALAGREDQVVPAFVRSRGDIGHHVLDVGVLVE